MNKSKIIIVAVIILAIAAGGFYFLKNRKGTAKQINIKGNSQQNSGPANSGPVSPISGVSCDNWNKRPVAVMGDGGFWHNGLVSGVSS